MISISRSISSSLSVSSPAKPSLARMYSARRNGLDSWCRASLTRDDSAAAIACCSCIIMEYMSIVPKDAPVRYVVYEWKARLSWKGLINNPIHIGTCRLKKLTSVARDAVEVQ